MINPECPECGITITYDLSGIAYCPKCLQQFPTHKTLPYQPNKRMIAIEVNGIQEAECPNCGNPMTTNKFDKDMQPLFYCNKCGEYTNVDPRVPVKEAQLPEDDSVDTGL